MEGELEPFDYDNVLLQFAEIVRQNPQQTAVIINNQAYSYQHLWDVSAKVAYQLPTQQTIAIYLDRNIDFIIVMLGIMRAGSAYLPIMPDFVPQRIKKIISDHYFNILITSQENFKSLAGYDINVLFINELKNKEAVVQPVNLPAVDSEAIANVLYTTGTTGVPKAVKRPHRALAARVDWMHKAFPYEDDDIACHLTSFGFVRSVWEFWAPFTRGIPCYILPRSVLLDLNKFIEYLTSFAITRLITTPTFLQTLLDITREYRLDFLKIKYWFLSGELLPSHIITEAAKRWPHIQWVNLYGATEVCSGFMYYCCRANDVTAVSPIGKPISNHSVYIVDDTGKLIAKGLQGQIAVAGPCVSLGYESDHINNQTLFKPNPFTQTIADTLYLTGDVGYIDERGNVICLGRQDRLVNVRGYRVSLEEIESIIYQLTSIHSVVVTVEEQSVTSLAVYLIMPISQSLNFNFIRQQLLDYFPDYLLPTRWLQIERLPLKENGKLDRACLDQKAQLYADTQPLTSETELTLLE